MTFLNLPDAKEMSDRVHKRALHDVLNNADLAPVLAKLTRLEIEWIVAVAMSRSATMYAEELLNAIVGMPKEGQQERAGWKRPL